ncbi:MAG: hypothetical protein IJG68_01050 [Bacilli bacterium]|nr:hypothetical protein [Bacilli bacterium]
MKKKLLNKIFIIAIAVALYSIVLPVSAEETICPDGELSGVDVAQRYGISLSKEEGNSYKLKMNPPSNTEERCKMKFKVSKINGNDVTIDDRLSCNELTLQIDGTTEDTVYGLPGIIIELTNEEKIIKNENESGSCYFQNAKVELTYIHAEPEVKTITCADPNYEDSTLLIPTIDCDNNTYKKGNDFITIEPGSFEDKFCYAKRNAGTNYSFDFHTNPNDQGKQLDFKCESDLDSGKIPLKQEDLEGEKYYVNKNYLYGKNIETITGERYIYNYAPGDEVKTDPISCEVTCEESVEVEYGPPVASKAGMCFEYKVRVTSRTSCHISKLPEKPRSDCSYCNPAPVCESANGSVWQQGGPNEEFDACIRSCDGGKYTKKCSNKCYKKVYASKTSTNQNNVVVRKLSMTTNECLNLNPEGCYYKSNGNILWQPGTYTEGRWYFEAQNPKYYSPGAPYIAFADGFFRRVYADGSVCNDSCHWTGCSGQYLNPNIAKIDLEENAKKYNKVITACKAKASCSTTTAEFTISADYTPEGKSKVTINFPYDNQKDTITHNNSTVTDTSENANTTLLPNDPTPGDGLWGCYKKNDSQENLYRSTWSFPGTWINGKTGEISFSPKSTSNPSWREHNDKFCIPADAERVNSDWWNWYNNKLIGLNNLTLSANTDATVKDKCENVTTKTVLDPGKVDLSKIIYNIHAQTQKFGYFDWNIGMHCFYALNPKPTTPTTQTSISEEEQKACVPTTENYRVRAVDLENVFPALDGSTAQTTTEAGRTPGFNWSEYAENTKNEKYTSNPKKYLEKVQSLGYGVYDEGNLDYEFTLSPQTIRNMRSNSSGAYSGTNYTNFDDSGFYVDSNGVSRYKSNKIRSLSGSNKLPTDNALLCNNMVNYNSSNCDIAG